METFLGKVADEVYKREKNTLHECCFVFPGRRATLFFSKYLSSHLEKATWSPDFLTITDLMTRISGYRLADSFQLIFLIYKLYKEKTTHPENFDVFYSFAEVLLNDFNDIDKNLVNASDLFKNLSSLKMLDDAYNYLTEDQREVIQSFWSHFETENLSDEKEKFTGIWGLLASLYSDLQNELRKTGAVYEGMIYRKVVEMTRENQTMDIPYRKIYFIGFNALTVSEKEILKFLQKSDKAEFIWDYDNSYVKDRMNEAGYFIRVDKKDFNEIYIGDSYDHLLSGGKNIEIIASPTDPGQIKIMTHELSEWYKNKNFHENNTAVVLADEHLISQVIHSIPAEFSDINVTMGYPVKDTPVFSLVECLVDLQKNKKEANFYYKDIIRVLDHQYISFLNIEDFSTLKKEILSQNRIYIGEKSFPAQELGRLIFTPINDSLELTDYLREILYNIYLLNSDNEELEEGAMDLQKEYLYNVYLALNRLRDILGENEPTMNIETFFKILKKIIGGMIIPFSGEPLRGLQVMGVLETRALDFENLIILSMNEGVFPRSGAGASVIPYSLRKGFGLPTVEYQDRIYAYYFYRLIQRARNIRFVYNTKTEGIRTGEISRFLYQLKYLNNFPMIEKNLSVIVNQQKKNEILVEKSIVEMDILKRYYSSDWSYLSPSGLNSYLNCSLKFYFRYVAGVKEPEKVTEEVDPMVFGNLLHMTMKILYENYKNSELTVDEIKILTKKDDLIQKIIEKAIKTEWLKSERDNELKGRNLIAKEILLRYVKQILKVDSRIAPIIIRGLEDDFRKEVKLNLNASQVRVRIGGKVDRIDEVAGRSRVIDYKTGSVNKKFPNIESLFIRNDDKRNSEAFQTLLYCWLYDKSGKLALTPGLYDIKGMNEDSFTPEFKMGGTEFLDFSLVSEEFERHLEDLISEIFNPNIAFSQTENLTTCKNCDYINICKRDE